MRHTHLLALAALAGITSTAHSQEARTEATRVRASTPEVFSFRSAEPGHRAAIGVSTSTSGTLRDTLGILITAVTKDGPAEKAGLEEGNRIAAINGVNLRVSRDDAGDRYLSSVKAQRLHREISQLKPGDNVTLSVYSGGRVRDVSVKVARAADIHGAGGMMYFGGDAFVMPSMPPMPAMPPMPPMPMIRANQRMHPIFDYEFDPELRGQLEDVRMHLDMIRPQLEHSLRAVEPQVRMQLERVRPQIERALRDVRPQIEQIRRQIPTRMLWVDA